METQNKSLKGEISSLKREFEIARSDLETQNKSLKGEISSLKADLTATLNAKTDLQHALDEASNYNITMEEKVYKSNRISLDLLKEIKELEIHIRNLEFQLGWYNPVKGDAIDCRLAEYINAAPERPALISMFVRENEGVYRFGTKKTNIKVEQGSIKIRVGGGYLSFDEFVDQYLPIEFEKVGGWKYATNNLLQNLSMNGSVLMNGSLILDGPVSPTRSP